MELNRFRGYSTINSCASQVIEKGSDDEWIAYSYDPVPWKVFMSTAASILTFGLWTLVMHWRPDWKAYTTFRPSALQTASYVLLLNGHGQRHLQKVQESAPLLEVSTELNIQDLHDSAQITPASENKVRYFEHHLLKYVWDPQNSSFSLLRGFASATICADFYKSSQGLDESQQKEQFSRFGPNVMDIEVKSYGRLFIDEVLNPFYFFQIASITLWSVDNYYYYASCIFIISMISISVSLYETKKQMKSLKEMISQATPQIVTVRRFGAVQEIPAPDVVPGDVLVLPPNGCIMACDAVLTAGNCIVNECMLTGECVPETKTPLPKSEEPFDIERHKRNILFSGTQVIQTRYYGHSSVTATVIRTGFSTAKGELVRSILFPKPMGFKFYRDSMRFVLILLALAACGTAYSLYLYISRNSSIGETVKKALDVVTIVVPPALPAALTVGTVYAQGRLKKKGIFCISPPRINLAGKIKLMCFDKTGTLTEGGLDFWGVIPVRNARFQGVVREDPKVLGEQSPILLAMATCHSLTSIEGELAGDPLDLKMFQATQWVLEEFGKDTNRYDLLVPSVVKPPRLQDYWAQSHEEVTMVDGKLFSTPVSVQSENVSGQTTQPLPLEVGLVRQFPFSSSLQCMSIICRILGSPQMDLFLKGAPEKVATLCRTHTIPEDFSLVLQNYTQQGLRVLALAHKTFSPKFSWHQAQRVKREKVERDLTFIGLLIMQNALKPETSPVISVIHQASIRMVMVTGDNILTAVSVGRDCGLIQSKQQVVTVSADKDGVTFNVAETPNLGLLESSPIVLQVDPPNTEEILDIDQPNKLEYCMALEGKSFTVLRTRFPIIFKRILIKGTIFARMSPDEKTQLVESFQELGYVTGMCGDGANDCGALKAAEVGISLSEAEASVAAPFTSHIPNIQCVPILIRDGRCSLVTSFALFKFIALYSIIQFVSVLILYSKGSNLSDAMFLYIDLALITTLAVVMGNTNAFPQLVSERPLSSLVNPTNVVSMLLQVILVTAVQAMTLFYLMSQTWYKPHILEPDKIIFVCWESTSIFFVTCFQYLGVAVIFSRGPPFRKPFYTNVWYVCALTVLLAFTCLLLFSPWSKLGALFKLVDWQSGTNNFFHFRLMLLFISVGNLILSFSAEIFVAQTNWLKSLCRILRRKTKPKNLYKRLEIHLKQDVGWPPLQNVLTTDLVFHDS